MRSYQIKTRTYDFVYKLSIIFLIAIPGSALVVLKAILMVLLLVATSIMMFSSTTSKKSLFHLIFWMAFIFVWTTVGVINNDENNALREGLAYISFLIFLYCFVVGLQWIEINSLLKIAALSVLGYGAIKFGVLVAVLLGIIDPERFYWWLKEAASGVVMSGFWGGGLPRITMANDYLLPIILLFLLIGYIKKKVSGMLFLLSTFMIFILVAVTLSRYLYLVTAVVLLTFMASYLLTRRVFKFSIIVFTVGIIVIPIVMIQMGYSERIVSRFSGADAASSDAVKSSQVAPILNLIDKDKILGHGFGLSMESAGRGGGAKQAFQAELQWLALTAKIGFVGLYILLAGLFYYSMKLLVWNKAGIQISGMLTVVWLLWLLAGFYNPVLLLTTTALNYLIIYAISNVDMPGHMRWVN